MRDTAYSGEDGSDCVQVVTCVGAALVREFGSRSLAVAKFPAGSGTLLEISLTLAAWRRGGCKVK